MDSSPQTTHVAAAVANPAKDAIVVLGCRVLPDGTPSAALRRRCERAAGAFHDGLARWVLACGGKRWNGRAEAHVMAQKLRELGVPEAHLELELESLTTAGNARQGGAILQRLGARRILLVTCDFHALRARGAFTALGFDAVVLPCQTPSQAEHLRRRACEPLFALLQRRWMRSE